MSAESTLAAAAPVGAAHVLSPATPSAAAAPASPVDAARARVAAFCGAAHKLAERGVCLVPDATQLAAEVHARLMLAAQQLAANNAAVAEYHLQVVLWLQPDCVDGFVGLAGARMRQGDARGAHALYTHAVRMQPNFAPAWCGLAAASAASGCTTDSVLACFREAARIDPECADAYVGMGSCAKEMRQMEQAEAHFATAVRLRPGDARLHAHLAGILYERQRLLEALHSYIAALQLEPTLCDAMNDMGNTYRGLGRLDDAYRCYAACLSQHAAAGTTSKAAVAVTYSNMGAILKLQGRSEEAIGCFDSAVRLVPDSADAQAALGGALKDAGQHEQALAYYRVALAMPPARSSGAPQLQQHATRAQFVHSLASVCAWDEFSTALPALREETRALLAAGQPSAVQPFHAMAYDLDAQLVLDLTRAYAAQVLASAKCLGVPAFAHPPAELSSPARRLRVGFVSSDIGQHPLSHLMGSVFGLMDRSCIEVFLYALSQPDGSPYRARIEADTEHFVTATALTAAETAAHIHRDGIQILVDLNGYTKGGRPEIFALRPAPVQIAYMGFPATTGAPCIDWLVTDRVVAPPSLRHCYSEHLLRLPNCYFVNDYARGCPEALDGAQRPTRAEVGLPKNAFVFLCANQLYKIDPKTFDTWCSILRRVPHAVLWLLRFPPFGEPRLRAEAARRGVAPERLIFTDVAAKQVHILRSSLADLFLDTPLCNAHTTGTDVLWSGVPILTLPGERFASRVGASLVTALGCADCVMPSHEAYEQRAVELATNPLALRALTARVRKNRLTHPLFNTRKWVQNFDNALLTLWRMHACGEPPCDIDLPDVTARQRGHGA